MAPITKTLTLAATAFAALSAAAPGHNHGHKHNHKRDAVTVWDTKTVVIWTTIDITTTETINHATAPEPEPKPETTSSTTGSGSSSGSGGPCSAGSPCVGQVTFYDTATSMSAPSSCGYVNDGSTENVIALPVGIMQDSDCGRTVVIKYNGKTTKGTVVDKCMGCDNQSIDLSRHFFSLLASFDAGRLHGVEWYLE
ncbi:hypothetical protein BJX64DRAFT_342 [Aspergillus heterothallicus]